MCPKPMVELSPEIQAEINRISQPASRGRRGAAQFTAEMDAFLISAHQSNATYADTSEAFIRLFGFGCATTVRKRIIQLCGDMESKSIPKHPKRGSDV